MDPTPFYPITHPQHKHITIKDFLIRAQLADFILLVSHLRKLQKQYNSTADSNTKRDILSVIKRTEFRIEQEGNLLFTTWKLSEFRK